MKDKTIELEGEQITVFYTEEEREMSSDYDSPSWGSDLTIYYLEINGVDILETLTSEEIEEITDKLKEI